MTLEIFLKLNYDSHAEPCIAKNLGERDMPQTFQGLRKFRFLNTTQARAAHNKENFSL